MVGWLWVFVTVLSFPATLIIHFLSCFVHEIKFIILSLQHHQIIASQSSPCLAELFISPRTFMWLLAPPSGKAI